MAPNREGAMMLDGWRFVERTDDRRVCVMGHIHGSHPRRNELTGEFAEGHRVVTSPVVSSDGRLVITESGSRYELLVAHPRWRVQLQSMLVPYKAMDPASLSQRMCAVTEEEAMRWERTE